MKTIVVLFLLVLVKETAAAARRDSHRVQRILVFGDSLADGFRLKRSEGFPALLTEKLRAAGLPFNILNASASGGTTEGGLRRLDAHLHQPVDIFILELGINDAFRGVALSTIRQNLQEMIDRVQARNPQVRVVILGMQLPNFSSDDYISEFGRIYGELATKNHAALVPYLLEGVAGNPDLNLSDGVHPNAAGQKILAGNVWRALEPVARETAAEVPAHVR